MLFANQYRMIANGRKGPPTTTPSGKTYSASRFMIAVCGLAAASTLCRSIDARLFMCVAKPANSINGKPIAITDIRSNS